MLGTTSRYGEGRTGERDEGAADSTPDVERIHAARPFGELLLAPMLLGYVSHDTTPWAEAVSGLFLMAAAVFVWPARLGRRPGQRGQPAPTCTSPVS